MTHGFFATYDETSSGVEELIDVCPKMSNKNKSTFR